MKSGWKIILIVVVIAILLGAVCTLMLPKDLPTSVGGKEG